jgi:hypothetical protein
MTPPVYQHLYVDELTAVHEVLVDLIEMNRCWA